MRSKKNIVIFSIILIGAMFRFYKLDWGQGYFFHPDEYHIGTSADQLSFPDQMHPHFFAYGTFISYLIYFSRQLGISLGLINQTMNPILIGRFFSALFSSFTIPIIYLVTKKITKKTVPSLIAAFITALSPGLIQQAHYATPESILIFWTFSTILLLLKWHENNSLGYLVLAAITSGAAISVKISALIFFPVYILAILIKDKLSINELPKIFFRSLSFIVVSAIIFLLIYPYSILDWKGFRFSMEYETGVGRGDPVVFYTRQFINTRPILFQFNKILPYVIDPLALLIGWIGILYSSIDLFKRRRINKNSRLIVLSAFLLFFFSSSFLFAKWTRFIIPSIPFIAIFVGTTIARINNVEFKKIATVLIFFTSFLWSWMFFQIYLNNDVRIEANNWMQKNLEKGAFVLTESGNMIEVPISTSFTKYSFDFYHLDEQKNLQQELPELLEKSNYFIIQSRRIYYNHTRLPDMFPITNTFYEKLFSGDLGYEKIKTFSSYPSLPLPGLRIELHDEFAEETWTVFDHPVLRVYKKTKPMNAEDYEKILQI